jgi:hypothetical protein
MIGTDKPSSLLSHIKEPKMRLLINGWQNGETPDLEEYFGMHDPDRHWYIEDLDKKNIEIAKKYREDILALFKLRKDITQVQRQWLIRLFFLCAPSVFEDDLIALLCDPDFTYGSYYISAGINQMNPEKVTSAVLKAREKGINTPLCTEITINLPRSTSKKDNGISKSKAETEVENTTNISTCDMGDSKLPPAIKKLTNALTGKDLISAIDNLERRNRQFYILAFAVTILIDKLTDTSIDLGPEANSKAMEYLYNHLNTKATAKYQEIITEAEESRSQLYLNFQTAYSKLIRKRPNLPLLDSDNIRAFRGIFALVANDECLDKLISLLLEDKKLNAKGEECRIKFKSELSLT